MSTITYYSLIVITQNELGKCISTISHAIWSPRTHCFSSKSKIHQIVHFGAISGCRKMQKWVMLIFRYPKHDPRIRTEPLEPMWFAFWEHGDQKRDTGLFTAILRFCHITINYLYILANWWSNILTLIGRAEGKSALPCTYK